MSTIQEAVLRAQRIYQRGWHANAQRFRSRPKSARQDLRRADQNQRLREHVTALFTGRSGDVTVTRILDRSIGLCPHCGAHYNAGSYVVHHADGRQVRFDTVLVHYAQKAHPITPDDVDADLLLAILADA